MPAESARLRRHVGRRDVRLFAVAAVLALAAVPLGLVFGGGSSHPPGCVTVSRAGFMGNQTEVRCGLNRRTPVVRVRSAR